MEKLKSFNELSKVLPIPEDAFAPAEAPEVPAGAFDDVPSRRKGEHPAYVRYSSYKTSDEYATFVFVKSTITKYFPKAQNGDRFELVQGKAPHKSWFMLRPATTKRGNKLISAGMVFHTKEYLKQDKIDKDMFYPFQLVHKNGVLYAVLHPELVPLLR